MWEDIDNFEYEPQILREGFGAIKATCIS
jgi:hypothetical protein